MTHKEAKIIEAAWEAFRMIQQWKDNQYESEEAARSNYEPDELIDNIHAMLGRSFGEKVD